MKRELVFLALLLLPLTLISLFAEEAGTIEGVATSQDGEPVHHARILLIQTGETTETDHDGKFRFDGVPPGIYDIFAEAATFTSEARLVTVKAGEVATVELVLLLSPVRQSITVTASGRHETAFKAVQSVTSMETFDIIEQMAPSVGEVLEGELGVAKRSFGPGSSRPIIRGFGGDRVLVLKDGMRSGSLGSQSGDHGEPVDPGNLERLEVVKGPSTLLYGSNAIGGVVNAITRHHEMHKHRHEGVRGQVTSGAGSNNGLAAGNASIEYGTGSWMFWGGGGGQRTGDYSSPEGPVDNSKTRVYNGRFGLGWFSERFYLSGGYEMLDGRYGIPFANEFHGHEHEHEGEEAIGLNSLFRIQETGEHGEEGDDHEEEELEAIDVDWQSHNFRVNTGVQGLQSFIENIHFRFNYTDWGHDEIEILHDDDELVGTAFENKQFTYRGDFDHRKGLLSGTFGIWGTRRNYEATGEEALSPPVDQDGFAVFALEELSSERLKFQFGGRIEHIRYNPKGPSAVHHHEHEDGEHEDPEFVDLPERDFTGFSGGVGFRAGLWEDGAFVAHFTSSYRPPALEELYNFGPHVGNLAFEIGNPSLEGERSNGFDLSLRHSGRRILAEANLFYYDINDFIFGAPSGEIEDGLLVLEYEQGDSRFVGAEARLDVGLTDSIWVVSGLDLVDAKLTETDTSLPRIPPLRGRIGADLRYENFSFRPEVVMAANQDQIFPTETETAGYTVVNLKASYTLPQQHFVHHFAFEVFNVGDTLYRNHVSFIKDLAPEMGRGVRFSYAFKFF